MKEHPHDVPRVDSCAGPPAQLNPEVQAVNLNRVWANVAAEVWARPVGWLERGLGSILHSPGLARALLTTPSLALSWILASAIVLAVGVIFTYQSDLPWVALLAPAVAGIGIAYAYGPGIDPAWELSETMAVSGRMVFLARVVAVFSVNAILGMGAALFSAQALAMTFSWLVPMTTVSALALAVATWARNAPVGVGAGLMGWAVIILATSQGMNNLGTAVSWPELLPYYGVATVILTGIILYMTSKRAEVSLWR